MLFRKHTPCSNQMSPRMKLRVKTIQKARSLDLLCSFLRSLGKLRFLCDYWELEADFFGGFRSCSVASISKIFSSSDQLGNNKSGSISKKSCSVLPPTTQIPIFFGFFIIFFKIKLFLKKSNNFCYFQDCRMMKKSQKWMLQNEIRIHKKISFQLQ